ncbi:hypothetical protein Esti_005423 [Eimeria stiedai]
MSTSIHFNSKLSTCRVGDVEVFVTMESRCTKATGVSFAAPSEAEGRGAAKAAQASSPAAPAPATGTAAEAAAASAAAPAATAAGEEEPRAGQQVVGIQMLCEGVLAVHPARRPVATPAAAASEAAEAAEAAAAIAAVGPADFRNVKSLSLSNRNLVRVNGLETFLGDSTHFSLHTTPNSSSAAFSVYNSDEQRSGDREKENRRQGQTQKGSKRDRGDGRETERSRQTEGES